MVLSDQALALFRGQVADIGFGAVFVFIGLTACAIAGIRRRSGTRIFGWLGLWSALYGAVQLSQTRAVLAASPHWLQVVALYANTAMTYLLVVFGALLRCSLRCQQCRQCVASCRWWRRGSQH